MNKGGTSMPRPVRCRRIGQMPAFRSFSPDDMGQLVSGYLDFAERQAEREQAMTMADWARHLDGILTSTGEKLLIGAGSVSHEAAMTKAETEYKKYNGSMALLPF